MFGECAESRPQPAAAGSAAEGKRAAQRFARRAADERRAQRIFRRAVHDARAEGAHALCMQLGACSLKVWLQQPTDKPQPTSAREPQPGRTQVEPQSARQRKRRQRNNERARKHQLDQSYKQLAGCRLQLLLRRAMRAIRFRRMWQVAGPALQANIAQRTVAHLVQQLPRKQQLTQQQRVQAAAPRAATPPRAAGKRTVAERSPEGDAVGQHIVGNSDTAAEQRRLPPRRLEYAHAAAAAFRKQDAAAAHSLPVPPLEPGDWRDKYRPEKLQRGGTRAGGEARKDLRG